MNKTINTDSKKAFNLLWETCCLYGKANAVPQTNLKNTEPSKRIGDKGVIKNKGAVSRSSGLKSGRYSDGRTLIKTRVLDLKQERYLTDCGRTCAYVAKTYGMTRAKVVDILGRVNVKNLGMIDDEICIKVDNKKNISDADSELFKIINIIEIYGGKKK